MRDVEGAFPHVAFGGVGDGTVTAEVSEPFAMFVVGVALPGAQS